MKKRSVANSLKRLESVKFLTDEALAKRVPLALRELGLNITRVESVLSQGALDDEWARYAAAHGMVVLTKDSEIKRKPNEVAAIETAGIGVFTLARGDRTGDEMIEAFTQALPTIDRVLQRFARPFIVSLSRTGAISSTYPNPLKRLRERGRR